MFFSCRRFAISILYVSFLVSLSLTLFLLRIDSNLLLFLVPIPSVCSWESNHPVRKLSCRSAELRLIALLWHLFPLSRHMPSTHFFLGAKSPVPMSFQQCQYVTPLTIKRKERVPICRKNWKFVSYGSRPVLDVPLSVTSESRSKLATQAAITLVRSLAPLVRWVKGLGLYQPFLSLPRRMCVNVRPEDARQHSAGRNPGDLHWRSQ
jgi:hypothetical protein